MQMLCTCMHYLVIQAILLTFSNITDLVQDILAQDGFKRDVWASHGWGVDESIIERGGDDELCSSKEGPKVAVKIFPLLASLATGRWPQVNGVCGDPHINQSPRRGDHQYHTSQQHNARMQHAEGTPAAEAAPQIVLKTFAQCFTAWRIN